MFGVSEQGRQSSDICIWVVLKSLQIYVVLSLYYWWQNSCKERDGRCCVQKKKKLVSFYVNPSVLPVLNLFHTLPDRLGNHYQGALWFPGMWLMKKPKFSLLLLNVTLMKREK